MKRAPRDSVENKWEKKYRNKNINKLESDLYYRDNNQTYCHNNNDRKNNNNNNSNNANKKIIDNKNCNHIKIEDLRQLSVFAVEVKSTDSVSAVQILWLELLRTAGIYTEIARVVSVNNID